MAKLPGKEAIKKGLGDIGGAVESALKFSPDRFRGSVTLGLGMASPNRFEVQLPNIDGMIKVNGEAVEDFTTNEDRNMLCTAASVPGRQISTQSIGYGIDQQTVAKAHSMNDVVLTFYLTNTYSMKHYFEEWQSCITSTDPGSANHVGYYDNYAKGKELKIRQYSRNGRRVYAVKLHDVYPTNVNSIELANAAQTQAMELTVQMTYRTYETERETWATGFPGEVKKLKDKIESKFNK